ncbi:cyclic nucleotide-binding/CBS domain-containing protein [Meiothermus sp. QL-1]|uniref:putative nucleotidyltransferase substrate binding domain-containing protein n=1 Tax=Meiothermus sp. QL-1 TaxID=2058095 RepID=UPI000E0A42EE|nr:putative nucleotidyltransferase substrate binding domain-containing protein [Meiothermus sp. QL-1]RDI94642.1 cyclic nucleotide-binding/CBS domain-containing protein [Meiothermus sp. QL-1]
MNPLDFVCQQAPFNLLPEEALQKVARGLEITFYPKNTKVLEQGGERSQHLYLIRKGLARLERDGQPVLLLEEGEVFGYPSLLAQEAPAFDVLAEEDLLVYRWGEGVFRQLMQYPEFAAFFTRGLAERLRISQRLESLVGLDLSLPVGELVTRPPVFIAPTATVGEAARLMRAHQISSVLVEGRPLGILTDRDLRNRVLAEGRGPETLVQEVMSAPLKSRPASTPLFEALAYMVEQGIHHLPLEEEGQIVGVVTDTVFMRQQARSPLHLLRRLERTRRRSDLRGYGQELGGVVELLLQGGLGAGEIGRSVSAINDQLIRILLRLAEAELGPPPTPYAWMVFGSEGRMEQTLLTDQDNALVYAEASAEAAAYFQRMAEFVVEGLLEAGFPPCPGGYMATRWCKPLAEWLRLFRHWIETPTPQELLEAQIFFDFRPVYGSLSLEPLEQVVAQSAKQGIFLAHLARAALQLRPPIGFFRRIREEEGGVDLKKGGIVPIVGLARVYALEAGSQARSTVERLRVAARQNRLSQEGAETLVEAFGFLMRLRLREQLASLHRGEPPSNRVPLERLSPLERRHLKEAFLHIREMQEALSHAYERL